MRFMTEKVYFSKTIFFVTVLITTRCVGPSNVIKRNKPLTLIKWCYVTAGATVFHIMVIQTCTLFYFSKN